MWNLSNFLSISRAPLALLFLKEDPYWRFFAIVCAMATDVLDGYLARRYRMVSRFGAILDPLMDRFFVLFALGVLLNEGRIAFAEVMAMLVRDLAILIFGVYLLYSGTWNRCHLRALWCGKATTILQFFVLLAISLGAPLPPWVYSLFIGLGALALLELFTLNRD